MSYDHKTNGERSYAAAVPSLWNPLPHSVIDYTSLDTLKRILKKHFFLSATMEADFLLFHSGFTVFKFRQF